MMNNPDHIMIFSRPLKTIFWIKILKFFDVDLRWKKFGSGNRDEKKPDAGSGINITDPQHCCLQYIGWAKMQRFRGRNLYNILRKVHVTLGWPQM
jgi:hypothetical protein